MSKRSDAITSPVPTDECPVHSWSKDGEVDEYVTLAFAIDRLSGYYDMEPEAIRSDLLSGAPFQTMSFFYRIEEQDS